MRKSVLTSVEPERAARGACPHVMSEAGRSEGSEHRLVLKSCTRRRGGVDVCSASIDGGLVCCKRSRLPVQPVQLRDAVDRPVIPATAIDQLRATESPADESAKILLRRASVALCKLHHESVKKRDDARGYSTQIGADGCPVDPRHPGGYEIFLRSHQIPTRDGAAVLL